MSKEINEIINNLCEKLGTSAQYLIPELARKNIAEDVFQIIVSVIAFAVLGYVTPKVWRYDHSPEDQWDERFWIIIPVILWFGFFVVFTTATYDLVGWLASPTAKAITQLTGMLK